MRMTTLVRRLLGVTQMYVEQVRGQADGPLIVAMRPFDEVHAAGYPGGYSRVRDYVGAVRPRQPVDSVVRFETPRCRQGHAASPRVVGRTPVAPLPASDPPRPMGINRRTSTPPQTTSPEVCSLHLPLTGGCNWVAGDTRPLASRRS